MPGVNQYSKVLFELAEVKRQSSVSDRDGYVHEVKEDKVRVVLGVRDDGTPWLSPWLHTTNMRGGARERRMFVKGQNVRLSAPGGDMRQATVTHGAEGKSFPAPAHAKGVEGETYQLDKLRMTKVKDAYDVWIADSSDNPPAHKEQTGKPVEAGASAQQSQQQQSQPGNPAMKVRLSESGGFTGRVGKDVRVAAHKDGAKMRHGTNAIFVDKDGCWSTVPLQQKDDPIPNDDS